MLHEFSVTLAVAILVSLVVSLTVTPMICAHFIKSAPDAGKRALDRIVEGLLGWMVAGYARTLAVALRHQAVMLFSLICVIILTVHLYIQTPRGFFPEDDTGLIMTSTKAAPDISFEAMSKLQRQAVEIILGDPAVQHVGSSIGAGRDGSVNRGRMFVNLKPLAERGDGATTRRVINRLRDKLAELRGLEVRMFPSRDIRVGARQGDSQYQYTLWDPDIDQLNEWAPKIFARMQQIPGLVDVSTDQDEGGLQLNVRIDRDAAARLGVEISDIDSALNNAFSQRQISTIYAESNQYRVILEIDPRLQRAPSDLEHVHVPSKSGEQIPIMSVIKTEEGPTPLVVNHQGPFPAVTITFNLAQGTSLDMALSRIEAAMAEMHTPPGLTGETAGDARAFAEQASQQPLLILAALLAVYIVLGVLYESLAHPLTIISTLPSAGLGALLALHIADMELSMTALIGVILLIGIVKKNGIILVDFALDGERTRGLTPARAIYEACIARFRPILMTTMAALLGAVPLAIAVGPGADIRRPLGITIIGGLLVSQILTLYTTPVVYLLLDRLHRKLGGSSAPEPAEAAEQTRG
jgi:multidrug efflux pump